MLAQRTIRALCHEGGLDMRKTYRQQSTRKLANIYEVVSFFAPDDTGANSCYAAYRPNTIIHALPTLETIGQPWNS